MHGWMATVHSGHVQCWYQSLLHGETDRLHLWPTWFDFVKCVPSPCWDQASCSSLPCSWSSCFSQRTRMWQTTMRIKVGRGRVGEWTESSLLQWPVWERWFYHPWHLSVWLQISCNFSPPLPSHSFSITLFSCLFSLLVPVPPNSWAVWLEYQWISLY